jgi:hypothetical protein
MSPLEVLQEWEARQALVRWAWGKIGVDGRIDTSVGRYPLRLQVWLASTRSTPMTSE